MLKKSDTIEHWKDPRRYYTVPDRTLMYPYPPLEDPLGD
jgi:hypothetical protein